MLPWEHDVNGKYSLHWVKKRLTWERRREKMVAGRGKRKVLDMIEHKWQVWYRNARGLQAIEFFRRKTDAVAYAREVNGRLVKVPE